MTELFYKKANPNELNILLQMKNWKEKRLFLPLVSFDNETKKMGIRKMACDVQKICKSKKWNNNVEKKCILKICQVLVALRKHYVLHQDVHLKNIVCNKSLTRFYLIDYDVSVRRPFSVMNLYEKKSFLFREDQFQLFWNFVFGHNEFINDFTEFRKKIRKVSLKKQNKLKEKCKIFFMKDYVDEYWALFISEKPIIIKEKGDQIVFKFFLMRLYLLYYIYISEPNPFYQDMICQVQW
jgi:hypothetical protein